MHSNRVSGIINLSVPFMREVNESGSVSGKTFLEVIFISCISIDNPEL